VLRDDINNALKQAMKAGDKRRVSTLRLVNSAVKNADIEARGHGKGPLSDDELPGLLQKMKTGQLLGICAVCAAGLVTTSMLSTGHFAMWSIILVGFFNSIMFPSIFTLGVAELGPLTGDGSGVMIMAIVGGALIPLAQGAIADKIGIHHAFFLPVICYLYILYFALSGSRPNSERRARA